MAFTLNGSLEVTAAAATTAAITMPTLTTTGVRQPSEASDAAPNPAPAAQAEEGEAVLTGQDAPLSAAGGGVSAGPFDGWFFLSVALLALAAGAMVLKVALPARAPVERALPLLDRTAGEQLQLGGWGWHQGDGLLPAGEPLQLRVQAVDGFHDLVDMLRALDRVPGIAQARALRLEQGDGVFQVTLSAPIAREALERAAGARLRQALRVEWNPVR